MQVILPYIYDDFNSTKVQFRDSMRFLTVHADLISIPLRYNLERPLTGRANKSPIISIPLRYNLEILAFTLPSVVGLDFNSTKVQFRECALVGDGATQFYFNSTKVQFRVIRFCLGKNAVLLISIPLRYNLESM